MEYEPTRHSIKPVPRTERALFTNVLESKTEMAGLPSGCNKTFLELRPSSENKARDMRHWVTSTKASQTLGNNKSNSSKGWAADSFAAVGGCTLAPPEIFAFNGALLLL